MKKRSSFIEMLSMQVYYFIDHGCNTIILRIDVFTYSIFFRRIFLLHKLNCFSSDSCISHDLNLQSVAFTEATSAHCQYRDKNSVETLIMSD